MLVYLLIYLSLSLVGIAGIQFFYMIYLDRVSKYQKERIKLLETRSKHLSRRLKNAETKITEQEEFIDSVSEEFEEDEEIWADVIEDR